MRRCIALVGIAVALVGVTVACGSANQAMPDTVSGATPATSVSTTATSTSSKRNEKIYNPDSDAKAEIAAALAQAKIDHRYVLVDFGANWCPECHTLDKVRREKPVSDTLSQGFHLVLVDIGETKEQIGVLNLDVTHKYGLASTTIPALAILSPDGALVATSNNGFFDDARAFTSDRVNSFLITYGPKASK